MNTIKFEMIKLLVMLQEILDKFVFTQWFVYVQFDFIAFT